MPAVRLKLGDQHAQPRQVRDDVVHLLDPLDVLLGDGGPVARVDARQPPVSRRGMEGAGLLAECITGMNGAWRTRFGNCDSRISQSTHLHSGIAAAMCLAPSALSTLLARLSDVSAPMVGMALLIAITPDMSVLLSESYELKRYCHNLYQWRAAC